MIVKISSYTSDSQSMDVSIRGTENPQLVDILFEGNEVTVSVDELRAAAIAFTSLKEEV